MEITIIIIIIIIKSEKQINKMCIYFLLEDGLSMNWHNN